MKPAEVLLTTSYKQEYIAPIYLYLIDNERTREFVSNCDTVNKSFR